MTRAGIYRNVTGCFSAVFLRPSYVLLRGKKKEIKMEGSKKGFKNKWIWIYMLSWS